MSWILYVALGLLGLIGSPIAMIRLFIDDFNQFKVLWPVGLLQFMIGILSLRMILWFLKGKEVIVFEKDSMIYIQTGTFWIKRKRVFQYSEIKKIELNLNLIEANSSSEMVNDFSRQRFIFKIQNTGRIRLIYTGFNAFKLLDNLSIEQAKQLQKEFEHWINEYHFEKPHHAFG